jgi:hypothetical protein
MMQLFAALPADQLLESGGWAKRKEPQESKPATPQRRAPGGS